MLLVAWLAFPLLLAGLSLGCGRLLEVASGTRLPTALVLPAGLTVVILAAQLATLTGATAGLAGPFVALLAAAGLGLARPWRYRVEPWIVGLAVAVFLVFAAPVLLSGQATFAGYIKLDDTATYFAMTDRVMQHARDLGGLPLSSYLRTLQTTIAYGYPTGGLMPLGIGHQLLSYDLAWLFQPYLAFLGAMLGLSLYNLLGSVVASRPLRAGAAFFAAQPALLYGYSLWGGVKELAGAWLLALIAGLVPWTMRAAGARAGLPLGAGCAALVCVLSLPGAVWLGPALIPTAGVVSVLRPHLRSLLPTAAGLVLTAALLAVPAFVAYSAWRRHLGAFQGESELAQLEGYGPLSGFQLFGIWPAGDFRVDPSQPGATYALIAIVIAAGLVGLWWAWSRRGWGLLVYVATAGLGCLVIVHFSSPWLDAKALAMASPAFLAVALAACGFRYGQLALLPVAVGVLWSNALAYHDVWLAPRGQLHELETIGSRFAGDGPALMTDYEPYGVRHFLRRLDAEGASELRFRHVFLTNGSELQKTESADIDRFRLDGLLVYRTLVLRRGPAASRPPSLYRLVWSGRYYEVWQRPVSPTRTIVEHLPLGNASQAAAAPRCADVLRLASLGGSLVTAVRPEAIALTYPPSSGSLAVRVRVPVTTTYTAWLGGDWFGLASVSADGRKVGERREELNWPGLFTDLGTVRLSAGEHVITLTYLTGGWHPGSGARPFAFGPLVLSAADRREAVQTLPASRARSLCGRSLDWVEAVR
jgi:hypothetical protein